MWHKFEELISRILAKVLLVGPWYRPIRSVREWEGPQLSTYGSFLWDWVRSSAREGYCMQSVTYAPTCLSLGVSIPASIWSGLPATAWPHSLPNPPSYTNKIDITTLVSHRQSSFVPERSHCCHILLKMFPKFADSFLHLRKSLSFAHFAIRIVLGYGSLFEFTLLTCSSSKETKEYLKMHIFCSVLKTYITNLFSLSL